MATKKIVLNQDTDEHLDGYGYKLGTCAQTLNYVLNILTVGATVLVFYWKPEWRVKLFYHKVLISEAQLFLLEDRYHQLFVADVTVENITDPELTSPYFTKPPSPWSQSTSRSSSNHDDDRQALLSTEEDSSHHEPYGKVFRYLYHHNIKYIWNEPKQSYLRLHGLDESVRVMDFHDHFRGLNTMQQKSRRVVYGRNEIDVKVKSYGKLFVEEVLNPFYVFQIASIALWMSDDYYYYAACIVVISLLSIFISLRETKKQSITLHNMVKTPEQKLNIYRGSEYKEEVTNFELVPGDIIEIPSGEFIMQCDAILLTGNCIVNEAMLTGESVPVTKTPLPHAPPEEIFNPSEYKRNTLFCGTQVIQKRYYGNADVKAIVIRTGYMTAKGELIRSILFPKPMDFKFYRDATKFIGVLAAVASIGMIYTIYIMIEQGRTAWDVTKRVLDIVTIVVPPALPAAMTVGMVYAQGRLKTEKIFCISPPRINLCGKLKLFCFDKTGTLTEEGLDLWGVVPVHSNSFLEVHHDPVTLPRGHMIAAMATCHSLTMIEGQLNGDPLDLKMFEATKWVLEEPGEDTSRFDSLMPTVVRPPTGMEPPIEMFPGIEISGDSMELSSKPSGLTESPDRAVDTSYEIGIVKQFTFSSSLQRMSVITRTLGKSHMELFAKGAPEKIASLCKPETLPADFHSTLHQHTMQGYRVIALATRSLENLAWHQAQRITRDQVEKDLEFIGLLIMQNALKPETTGVIKELRMANIRTVMVTGDNILTAISVARQCSIISSKHKIIQVEATPPGHSSHGQTLDHTRDTATIRWTCPELPDIETDTDAETGYQSVPTGASNSSYTFAVDGKSFAVLMTYFPELMPRICLKGSVFARMAPEQKAQLVEQLQALGYGVGMCGDGANDCSALKASHAGISLSEAEASVASPFTSQTPNISCVPTVIREGRAALTTSFGCFKYMALYSLIQFVSVLILYTAITNLGDTQFLYIDLLITTTVAFLMGHTHAYHKLVAQRPKGSLMSFSTMFSLFSQIVIMGATQLVAYYVLCREPWFVPNVPVYEPSGDPSVVTFEATTIFLVSSFLYISVAVNFSIGPPYRKRIWTNKPFFISSVLLFLLSSLLLFYPPWFLAQFLQMKNIDYRYYGFRIVLFEIVAIHFIVSSVIETFIVDSVPFNKFSRLVRQKKQPLNKYKRIAAELKQDALWPPIGEVTTPSSVQIEMKYNGDVTHGS